MAKITLYHNPRCSKSREAKRLLEEQGAELDVVEYLKTPLGPDELRRLVKLLKVSPEALVRKKEAEFKEHYKGKSLDTDGWIEALAAHPKLLERPIAVAGKKAAVGRPPENVLDIL